MVDDDNPYAAPNPVAIADAWDDAATPERVLVATAAAGGDLWQLFIFVDRLELARGETKIRLAQAEARRGRALRLVPLLRDTFLNIRDGSKKHSFRLDDEAAVAVMRWVGTDHVIKTGPFQFLALLGIFWMVTSLPLEADPEVGAPAIEFDAAGFGVGAGLVVLALLRRLWPRRWLAALDVGWWIAVSVYLLDHARRVGLGWAAVFFGVAIVMSIVTSSRLFLLLGRAERDLSPQGEPRPRAPTEAKSCFDRVRDAATPPAGADAAAVRRSGATLFGIGFAVFALGMGVLVALLRSIELGEIAGFVALALLFPGFVLVISGSYRVVLGKESGATSESGFKRVIIGVLLGFTFLILFTALTLFVLAQAT